MEFRVLGPLEIRADGDIVPLGAPAERQLLAVLLVFANQTVSTERLIDELWVDDPPATARNLIQGYVSRLRKILHDPSGQRLVTETPGYRLVVGDDEVDAARFERLVAAARNNRTRTVTRQNLPVDIEDSCGSGGHRGEDSRRCAHNARSLGAFNPSSHRERKSAVPLVWRVGSLSR